MATTEDNRHSNLVWVGLLLLALVAWYLYERKQVASGKLAAAQISNPIARAMGWFAHGSQGIADRAGPVGSAAGRAVTQPVTNVVSGNVSKTLWSAASGGLSDVFGWG